MLLVTIALSASCTRSPIPFGADTSLSPAEELELSQQVHWPGWRPHYTALWVQDGGTARVCLADSGFSGIRAAYQAFVFDQDGRLLEVNTFPSFPHTYPKAVVGIAPLRVQFEGPDGSLRILNGSYLRGEGVSEIREHLDQSRDYVAPLGATNRIPGL